MPTVGTGLFPSEGKREIFRRYCGLDAGGEIDPFPRGGDFRPGRAGAFLPPSAAGEFARCGVRGRDAAGRQPGTRPSRGEGQKGVQDTTKDVVSAVAH